MTELVFSKWSRILFLDIFSLNFLTYLTIYALVKLLQMLVIIGTASAYYNAALPDLFNKINAYMEEHGNDPTHVDDFSDMPAMAKRDSYRRFLDVLHQMQRQGQIDGTVKQ